MELLKLILQTEYGYSRKRVNEIVEEKNLCDLYDIASMKLEAERERNCPARDLEELGIFY